MLERLPIPLRTQLGPDIGQAVYEAIGSDYVAQAAADLIGNADQPLMRLKIAMLHSLTAERKHHIQGTFKHPEQVALVEESPMDKVIRDIRAGKYDGLVRHDFVVEAAKEKASDLMIEAVDDTLFWFDQAIVSGAQTAEELVGHPVLASATGVHDKTHRVAKGVFDIIGQQKGVKLPMPRSHNDLVTYHDLAPELFAAFGIILDVDTYDQRDPAGKGLCPAHTIDPEVGRPWYKSLALLVAPVYLDELGRAGQAFVPGQ